MKKLARPLEVASPDHAAHAVNALGLDLHRQMPKEDNACLSPYSIQSALAITYLGANGITQEEMARVFHFSSDKQALSESFLALKNTLDEAQEESLQMIAEAEKYGGSGEPVRLLAANQLFGQEGYQFRPPFLAAAEQYFGAPLRIMPFGKDPTAAAREINDWVAKQTQDRIRDLISPEALSQNTRLVLANALYFKASWAYEFDEEATSSEPFYVNGGSQPFDVQTMQQTMHMGYYAGKDFHAVTLPYIGGHLHLLLVVPVSIDGLGDIEAELTPEVLFACGKAENREVILNLPKFKITPPSTDLSEMLQKLGMKTAFDQPRGSADFDAMAPKHPQEYLFISNVLHKTFLALDEKGTEAAAATVIMAAGGCAIRERPKPIVLKADRPFLFAIQHAVSGACLFLGRVTDPR